jgi:hypothetical protein
VVVVSVIDKLPVVGVDCGDNGQAARVAQSTRKDGKFPMILVHFQDGGELDMAKVSFLALAAALIFAGSAGAKEYVDLELVIATDVSRSIDSDEARLQRQGIAAAFKSDDVVKAISSGVLQRITVAYVDYSSRDWNRLVIDWRVIRGRADAHAFADELLKAELTFGRRTSIADALEHATQLIESNDIEGTRRVIDVSGDGPNNFGRYVDTVRDETIAKRITVNGLPIINQANTFSAATICPISIFIIVAA